MSYRYCRLLISVVFYSLFLQGTSLYGQEADSLRISEYPIYDSLMPRKIHKFGIQTGFVFTPELDMGVDYGGRISQRFFHPYFQLTSQLHFWVASNDSVEMAVVGLEESITYSIPIQSTLFWSGGFSIGYFGTYEDKEAYKSDTGIKRRYQKKLNSIDSFIIMGIEYVIDRKRSVYIQGKYGTTDMGKEYHLVSGINFLIGK